MLLVEDSMTREVSTLEPAATAAEALRMCRERRIRHLPVLENGKLAGIVSDRDLRSAVPLLSHPERAEALEQLLVEARMTREVITAHPLDLIEHAATEMYERRIGCLPVVSGGDLVGIITSSDIMRALVELLGAHKPGSPLEIEMPERAESLAEVAGIISDSGSNVVSVLTSPEDSSGKLSMIFRLGTIDPRRAIGGLRAAGYKITYPLEQG